MNVADDAVVVSTVRRIRVLGITTESPATKCGSLGSEFNVVLVRFNKAIPSELVQPGLSGQAASFPTIRISIEGSAGESDRNEVLKQSF